jgi:hypothetical protein
LLPLPLAGVPDAAMAAQLTLFAEKRDAVRHVRAVLAFDRMEFSLTRLRPDLVYVDSNLYGLNLTFLNQFNQSGAPVFVASIFSRQAGADLAQTMIRFFRALHNGDRPARALYLARKTLYDSALLAKADTLSALRSAFPFRLYWLNQAGSADLR